MITALAIVAGVPHVISSYEYIKIIFNCNIRNHKNFKKKNLTNHHEKKLLMYAHSIFVDIEQTSI